MVTASRSAPAGRAGERTEDVARAFGEHGFVHVPGFFSEQEVAQFKAAAVNIISAESIRNRAEAGGTDGAGENSPCDACVNSALDAGKDTEALRGLALHPGLGALAERLAGMPLRVWLSALLVKQCGGDSRPTSLHDDLTTEELDSRISLNAWVALVDVPVERGCMTFLDGSHRREGPERVDTTSLKPADVARSDTDSYLFTYWPGLRWTPRLTVPLRAGDVTFHHRRTAHMAGANQTQDDRIALGVTFTDAMATYQPLPGRDSRNSASQAGDAPFLAFTVFRAEAGLDPVLQTRF